MVAAVQCGADAVYLGASDFNARRNADNFGGELDSAVAYCHARNAKVYVTLNTMVRQDELDRLENTIAEICRAGADGVIVQDLGVARAVHQMAPTLPLHASTQMAVHNRQGVDFLVEQGFSRVVLAREMEYAEIARCTNRGAEIEVFVHGALCVSCSGQCLLSSIIGGRSGNRGLCAQPCRMKYRMGDAEAYLLSTKDLCGLDGLEALVQAGAGSLKIEGRLKRPEYVAQTVSTYREALDQLLRGEKMDIEGAKRGLRQMFNRGGFTRGYGFGAEDAELMYSFRPNHLGVEIGTCRRNGEIELDAPTEAKDVLALRRAGSEDIPVRPDALFAGRNSLPEARRGDQLIRLVSDAQMRACQSAFAGEKKKFPIDMHLQMHVGQPAQICLSDGEHSVTLRGDEVQAARSRPADPERIRAQMEKLGDTPFMLRDYAAEIDEAAFLPVSALNGLRRCAVETLFEARIGEKHTVSPMERPAADMPARTKPELIAQSGSAAVLQRALRAGADRAVYAPEDVRADALNAALDMLPEHFDLALPPVLSEDALNGLNAWANAHGERIRRCYISNIGQMALAWPGELAGDLYLNIANTLSVEQLNAWGIELYTPSIELNCGQIRSLGGRRQLVVYGAIPLMQLRHCPIRATQHLKGRHRDCRRCDACAEAERMGAQKLTDRTGATFPLKRIASESGCVIQLLNSAKLMLLRKAQALPACEGWRMLLDESDPVEAVVALHAAAAEGKDVRAERQWPILNEMNTTTGHYFRGVE